MIPKVDGELATDAQELEQERAGQAADGGALKVKPLQLSGVMVYGGDRCGCDVYDPARE